MCIQLSSLCAAAGGGNGCCYVYLLHCSSEFLELEATPTASHLEGPLERGSIASSTLPEMNQEEPLERFFVWHPHPVSVVFAGVENPV
jgi:hypothetical protein